MESMEFRRPATNGQYELLELVEELNGDDNVDGILVQLPLREDIDDKAVIAAIDPDKDVDGFHVVNAGMLDVGEAATVHCTQLGRLMLLRDELVSFDGLEAVIVGRFKLVGQPMTQLLLTENCTVTLEDRRTHGS